MRTSSRTERSVSVLTMGVYFLVGAVLVLGQLVPGITHQVASGEMLPQVLLWLLAAALLATDAMVSRLTNGSQKSGFEASALSVQKGAKTPTQSGNAQPELSPSISRKSGRGRELQVLILLAVVGLAWMGLATWHTVGRGNVRFAMNTYWQWISAVVAVLVLVKVMASTRLSRMVFALMFAVAWLSTISGFYQVYYSLPRDRAMFKANPTEVLRNNGIEAAPWTSSYLRFESRLNDDTPLGPFPLTNSLAGFLLPWIVLAVGLGVRKDFWRSAVWRAMLGMMVLSMLLWCFILTKSRAAWLALAAGIIVIVIGKAVHDATWRRRFYRTFIASGGWQWIGLMIAFFVGLLFVLGIWDSKLLTEAGKSLLFRSEYWLASLNMIRDHAMFGVGPGNFQSYYASYKPILAPETVVDPHNFILETAAVSGAALGLVLIVIVFLFACLVYRFVFAPISEPAEPLQEPRFNVKASSAIYIGGIAGAFALWFGGGALGIPPDATPFLIAMPLVVGVLMADYFISLRRPAVSMQATGLTVAMFAALTALGVHLLASSGWMTPGIMNSGCVLVAGTIALVLRSSNERSVDQHFGPTSNILIAVAAWSAVALFYWSAWLPRQNSMQIEAIARKSGLDEAKALAMIEADAWNPTGRGWLAEIYVSKLEQEISTLGRFNPDNMQAAHQFVRQFIDADPASAGSWSLAGHWMLRLSALRNDDLKSALEYYRQAASRDPGDIGLATQTALVAWLCDEEKTVAELLSRVESLDKQTLHPDRKLGAATVFWPNNVGPSPIAFAPRLGGLHDKPNNYRLDG